MSKFKVELNHSGVRSMLRSKEMMEICEGYADAALSRLGSGYKVSSQVGKNRVNAEVAAVSAKAIRENSKDNAILKAL